MNLASLKEKATAAANVAKERAQDAKQMAQDASKKAQEATKKGSELIRLKAGNISSADLEAGTLGADDDDDTLRTMASSTSSSSNPNTEGASLLDELNQQCKLTKKQRLYGALTCYVLGAVFGLFSTLFLMSHRTRQFAFCYTVGSLTSIGSSLFLVGPLRQVKVMCQPIRQVAVTVWLVSMVLTIFLAIAFPRAGLAVLLLVIIQYLAMLWYGASFIPYGRAMIRKCCYRVSQM